MPCPCWSFQDGAGSLWGEEELLSSSMGLRDAATEGIQPRSAPYLLVGLLGTYGGQWRQGCLQSRLLSLDPAFVTVLILAVLCRICFLPHPGSEKWPGTYQHS